MPTFREVVTAKNFGRVLQILGVLGAFGSGSFTLSLLMWRAPHAVDQVRVSIAFVYIVLLSVVVPAAELGWMDRGHLGEFARFMLSHVGRAFLYIFIGCLLLGRHAGGWVVGVYMIALGALNVAAACVGGSSNPPVQ